MRPFVLALLVLASCSSKSETKATATAEEAAQAPKSSGTASAITKPSLEHVADEFCACKDKACLDAISAKYKDTMPAKDSPDGKLVLTDSEKKAVGRMLACAMKMGPAAPSSSAGPSSAPPKE